MALSKPPAGYLVDIVRWVALEPGHISPADLITYNRKDFDDVPGLDLQVLRHESAL